MKILALDLLRWGPFSDLALDFGEEAIAVGAIAAIAPDDFIVSHHRGHGHCIAKGASPDRMMAELFGKAVIGADHLAALSQEPFQ